LGDAVGIDSDIGKQPAISHRQEGSFIIRRDVQNVHIGLVLGHPIFVMGNQDVSVCGTLVVHSHGGALGQVQGVHGHRFHDVQHSQVIEFDSRAFGDPHHFFHVLRIALLGERDVLAGLDPGSLPLQLQPIGDALDQLARRLEAVVHLRAEGFPNLAADLAMRASDAQKRRGSVVKHRLEGCMRGRFFAFHRDSHMILRGSNL
jgi:hypothetical protein